MTTSEVCARAAIGSSAAEAAPPSKTFRRVMLMTWSFVAGGYRCDNQDSKGKASKYSKVLILEVGDEHQSRRMCYGKRQPRRSDYRLRCHAARPEYRDLIGGDRHRVAIVRLGDVTDADRVRKAEVNRRAMHRWKAGRDLHRA